MAFNTYDWVGKKQNNQEKIINTNTPPQLFFIREKIGDEVYICDEYSGGNHVRNHVEIKLPEDTHEKKIIKATYKIREWYPDTATWVDNPRIFNSIEEIDDAVAAGVVTTDLWGVWALSIYYDSDCRRYKIDSTAPWPPKAL